MRYLNVSGKNYDIDTIKSNAEAGLGASEGPMDYGRTYFPALEVMATDNVAFESTLAQFYATLFIPERDMEARYMYLVKGNADAAESAQMSIWGPVDPPVRGSRIITPSTDTPLLIHKSPDTVASASIGLVEFDGGGNVTLLKDMAYWIVAQFEEAMNVTRLFIRAQHNAPGAGVVSTTQQLAFVSSAGSVPAYGDNFGTIDVTTMPSLTWNANNPQLIIAGVS